jgi:hypothetical protein
MKLSQRLVSWRPKQLITLVNEKYSFRNSSSTEKANFKLRNDISLALNKKLTVGGIF